MRVKVSVESIVLVAICLADMLATLYFVVAGMATECNPLMAVCIDHSPEMFVLVKVASFVPFVIAVELYRRRNPAFTRVMTRSAIVLYLVTFAALTMRTNIV